MAGLREFLIGIANIVLFVMIVVIPLVAFVGFGSTASPYGRFSVGAGLLGALGAFLVSLPGAAILALFLDMREQLVSINQKTKAIRISDDRDGFAVSPTSPPAQRVEPILSNNDIREMRELFFKTYKKSISVDQAQDLIYARSRGTLGSEMEKMSQSI
ncbi:MULTISPECIES: hypothetical protein [Roseomonadaceae]|uniref:Uncharacterized protein n=1 Tax=Falsiroseomonas oleicola TaxID=2801474 RepID=A0ABS6H6M2_9PROT|nr:hypothetical protein [Roseomonas oleicola]MBU8544344.1 hypothetical protein [Roseomonas oleicola]